MSARELDLFESVSVIAKQMPDAVFTRPDDDWVPILFVEGKENVTVPLDQFMTDDRHKDVLANVVIPAVIEEFAATRLVMVMSVWTSAISSKLLTDKDEYIPPSQQPDREECVYITEYTHEGVTRQAYAPILRSETEVPQLGEWRDMTDVKATSGRFIEPIVAALKEVAL